MGKYLDKVRQHERTQPVETVKTEQALTPIPTIQPGDRITWQGADLTLRHGVVDGLHTDAKGIVLAFCTCPDGRWAVVDTKCITNSEDSNV
jgi:hypothetical protein